MTCPKTSLLNFSFFYIALLCLLPIYSCAQARMTANSTINFDMPEIVDEGGLLVRPVILSTAVGGAVLFDLPEGFSFGTGINFKTNPVAIRTKFELTNAQSSGDFQFEVPLIFTWKKTILNTIFEPQLSVKPGILPNLGGFGTSTITPFNSPTMVVSYQHLSTFILSYNISLKESFILSERWTTAILFCYNRGINAGSQINIAYTQGTTHKAQIINNNRYVGLGICFDYKLRSSKKQRRT